MSQPNSANLVTITNHEYKKEKQNALNDDNFGRRRQIASKIPERKFAQFGKQNCQTLRASRILN